ncbi:hypothetical protein [Psychrobacillus sp. FSL K6-1464]|uniref:hypothetical protein n=1 Tax=Psychrobacillus sp. FSL K6-1464 TaxID=2921545 RepID=UPI0030F524B7
MKLLKENILETLLLIGVILLSIGFFMLYIPLGFIATGILLICIVFLVHLQRKGGE